MTRRSTATIAASLAVIAAASSSTEAFVAPRGAALESATVSRTLAFRGRNGASTLFMSSTDDEIAALRAAAAKAREEAAKLAKELGKDIPESPTADSNTATATASTPTKKAAPTAEEVSSITSTIDFDNGDAITQTTKLDELIQSGDLSLWKSAVRTANGNMLRPYPVSLTMLESRTGGKLTGETLGVGGEMDVELADFRDVTMGVTLGCTALAIGSLVLLPENIGATLCYLFALLPVGFIALGSTAPGVIAGAIASFRDGGDGNDKQVREDRICRHEAGHFLCGYLCGLPVRGYSTMEGGFPSVEFHPTADGDASMNRELTMQEVAALSVVAMSGSVAEALGLGKARGGESDLRDLDALFRRSEEFIGAQKQQDMTRWGALVAYNLIQANRDKYEDLVQAFKDKKSVAECVAILESQ